MTLGDHHVDTAPGVVARLLHVAAEGHHLDAEPMRLGGQRPRRPQAGHDHRHALVEAHVDPAAHAVGELLDLGARAADGREQDVHAEGPVGEIADPSNLRAQFGGRAVGGGQHAKPSGLGHRRHQGRARHEGHPGLAHRVADAEQIAERSVERAARERRHGPARPQRSRSSAARPTSAFFRNSSCASSAPSSGNVRLTMARIFFCRSSSRVCWISASVT